MSSSTEEFEFRAKADGDAGTFLHNTFVAPAKEILEFRELVRNIVLRDLKVRYKRSVLGVFWTVLAPLMSMTVLWVVFTIAMKVNIPNYASYLLSGIILWNFFLQSSSAATGSIFAAAGLMKKVRMPRVVFPISVVVNNFVNFSFSFVALLVVMLVTQTPFVWTMIFFPLMLIPFILFVMGWSMIVSSLAVFFRDLQYILEVGLGALFYMTPIIFDPSSIPQRFHWILSVNPLSKFIFIFRKVLFDGALPPLSVYLNSLLIGLIFFVIGWTMFQRLQRKFLYWL